MVFSTSAFGTYFRLTQGSSSNSSHVDLLAPVSVEPADASVGLAWLAVGSMCLFIAGEKGSPGGWVRATILVSPMPCAAGSHLASPLCPADHGFWVYSSDHVLGTAPSPSVSLTPSPCNSPILVPETRPGA